MNKRKIVMNSSMFAKENFQVPTTSGIYSKYIYEDLVKIRSRKTSATLLQDRKNMQKIVKPERAVQCSLPENPPTSKDNNLRSSLSPYLVKNEGNTDMSVLIKEKDEHINMLRKLLSKAIKLLADIQSGNSTAMSGKEVQNFLDTIANSSIAVEANDLEEKTPERKKVTNNYTSCKKTRSAKPKLNRSCVAWGTEDREPKANSKSVGKNLKSVESALKSFLGGFNSIKAELSMIGETLTSFEAN